MANTKISALPSNNNPTGSEELVYAYNNANGKMTLNTMKTFASADSQPTLVSGTNIKTINNQSILGAGNIDIQGGGGGGGVDAYDAVVDASGQGDYTTIGAAVDDNKRKIFVKNGTYNETQGHFITMSAIDKLIIHGQSRVGVIVNAELTSVQTQWSEAYNYPALFFLDMRGTDNSEVDVKNMTFNLSINSNEIASHLIKMNFKNNSIAAVSVDNCIFNVSNDGTYRMFFQALDVGNSRPYGNFDISNCVISMVSNTANMYFETGDVVKDDLSNYRNCYFTAAANNSNKGFMYLNNLYDCVVKYDTSNMGGIDFTGINLDNCDIDLGTNVGSSIPASISVQEMRNCQFEFRHVGSFNPTKVQVSSAIPEWQANIGYTLGQQIIHGHTFYKCNTAHTSASDWYTDNEEDMWDAIATISISNATGNYIRTGETVDLDGVIKGNRFDMSFNNGDLLLGGHCVFDGNFMDDDSYSHNMYVYEHNIINGNHFGGWTYANGIAIRYDSTKENIITNNMLSLTSNISKIGTGSAGVVANNASWS